MGPGFYLLEEARLKQQFADVEMSLHLIKSVKVKPIYLQERETELEYIYEILSEDLKLDTNGRYYTFGQRQHKYPRKIKYLMVGRKKIQNKQKKLKKDVATAKEDFDFFNRLIPLLTDKVDPAVKTKILEKIAQAENIIANQETQEINLSNDLYAINSHLGAAIRRHARHNEIAELREQLDDKILNSRRFIQTNIIDNERYKKMRKLK